MGQPYGNIPAYIKGNQNYHDMTNQIFALFLLAFGVFFWNACRPGTTAEKAKNKAQRLVDQAIAQHGSDRLLEARLTFDFRDYHYVMERNNGNYRYERIFTDSAGRQVRDVFTNSGLSRQIDGQEVELPEEKRNAYANSVNSVIYFATLPLSLNDPAVQKTYLGSATIKGEPYEKVKITFRQKGGGDDFQDEYVYWFHRDRHTIDYLAYNYQTDGGGARFREAYHVRDIKGIRFQDYYNFKPIPLSMEVARFDSLFEAGQMERVSVIETENIEVAL